MSSKEEISKKAEELNTSGFFFYNQGKYEDAIKDYNRAIELNPNEPFNWNNRGNSFKNLKRYEEAIKDYNKAI